MLRIWRLSPRHTVESACNGEGAKKYGGRWNKKGTAAIYSSATLSLCVLEVLVHTDTDLLPDHSVYSIDIPDDLLIVDLQNALPENWRTEPAPESLQEIGNSWSLASTSAILRLPSAIVPSESNYILNPAHLDFARIIIRQDHRFSFDKGLKA
jgi:RES domain-containing protein